MNLLTSDDFPFGYDPFFWISLLISGILRLLAFREALFHDRQALFKFALALLLLIV
jgi:hypothetical protein